MKLPEFPEPDTNAIAAPESDYLYVEASQLPDAGNGLYTAIPVFQGEIIALYAGEILTKDVAKNRADLNEDKYFIQMQDGSTMDSMHSSCFAKYANDANGMLNSGFRNNAKIALDEMENVCLIATRSIKTGEEILCSYGKGYWKGQGTAMSKSEDQLIR